MKNPFLIGSTTYLRPLEVEDASTVVSWFNDPEVSRFLLQYQPLSRFEEEEFIRQQAANQTRIVLGIVLRDQDRLIGVTGFNALDLRNRHGSFGITLGEKDTWGKGYGSEVTRLMIEYAFQTLNLNRIWLHVYEYNVRGIRTYEKAGFVLEGRLRQDTFRDGRYWDTLVMGLLRQDFYQANRLPQLPGEADLEPSGP